MSRSRAGSDHVPDHLLRLDRPPSSRPSREPGFVNAMLHCVAEDPSLFMLCETWADLADVVRVQVNRDYRKPYLEKLPGMLRSPREIQIRRPQRADFAVFA